MSQQHPDDKPIIIREASSLTAEMVAAIRAKTENTPEAKALVTISGTVIANIVFALASQAVINISPVRDAISNYLCEKHLPEDGQTRIFVDLACGYSSRGAVLARLRPDVQVYEIDLPPVINEKLKRYGRRGIEMPANHHMVRADMKTSSLSDLLDGQKADVVMARGLFIYFDLDTIKQASHNIQKGLKPGGHLICDLVEGTDQSFGAFAAILNFIRRQTNSDASRGRVASPADGEALFLDTGYAAAKAYHFSDFEDTLSLPQPYNNMMLLVEARAAAEEEATAKTNAKPKRAKAPAVAPQTTEKSTALDHVKTEPMKPDLLPTAAQQEEPTPASTESASAEETVEEELAVEDTQNKSDSDDD